MVMSQSTSSKPYLKKEQKNIETPTYDSFVDDSSILNNSIKLDNKLSRSNFISWRLKTKIYLEVNDLWTLTQQSTSTLSEALLKRDKTAFLFILSRIDETVVTPFLSCCFTFDLWSQLESFFLPKDDFALLSLESTFLNKKMLPHQNIQDYVDTIRCATGLFNQATKSPTNDKENVIFSQ